MAKLAAIALLLVALAASASAYTTVTTTVVTEETTNPLGLSCMQEMQQKMPLRQCMSWMQKVIRGPFLRSAVANPRYEEEGEGVQECCSEINEFTAPCRCAAVKGMMSVMPQFGEMEKVKEMVRSLPRMCGISGCQF